MRYLFFLISIFYSQLSLSQSNLIFFTEEGENFTLYINGLKVNSQPTTNVMAEQVSGDFAQVKIIFETKGAPQLKKGMLIDLGNEMSTLIKKNKKGKYIFKPVNSVPILEESISRTVEIAHHSPTIIQSYTESSSDFSAGGSVQNESMDINVNVGDQSIGVAVNTRSTTGSTTAGTGSSARRSYQQGQELSARVEGKKIILSDGRIFKFNYYNANRIGPVVEMKNPVGAQVTISYDGQEAYSGEVPFQYKEEDWKKGSAYFTMTVRERGTVWSVKLKHSGKIIIEGDDHTSVVTTPTPAASTGCSSPMSDNNFKRAKESIQGKTFSEEQMTVFKQIIRSNCL
ncbi:MAG: hypothetical protein AAFN93_18720, partial [Bacteroidota bacterium]